MSVTQNSMPIPGCVDCLHNKVCVYMMRLDKLKSAGALRINYGSVKCLAREVQNVKSDTPTGKGLVESAKPQPVYIRIANALAKCYAEQLVVPDRIVLGSGAMQMLASEVVGGEGGLVKAVTTAFGCIPCSLDRHADPDSIVYVVKNQRGGCNE